MKYWQDINGQAKDLNVEDNAESFCGNLIESNAEALCGNLIENNVEALCGNL